MVTLLSPISCGGSDGSTSRVRPSFSCGVSDLGVTLVPLVSGIDAVDPWMKELWTGGGNDAVEPWRVELWSEGDSTDALACKSNPRLALESTLIVRGVSLIGRSETAAVLVPVVVVAAESFRTEEGREVNILKDDGAFLLEDDATSVGDVSARTMACFSGTASSLIAGEVASLFLFRYRSPSGFADVVVAEVLALLIVCADLLDLADFSDLLDWFDLILALSSATFSSTFSVYLLAESKMPPRTGRSVVLKNGTSSMLGSTTDSAI